MVIGINLTFGPMHIVGLEGQSRRTYHVDPGHGLRSFWNLVETIGAFILAIGDPDLPHQRRAHQPQAPHAPLDPWDARTSSG